MTREQIKQNAEEYILKEYSKVPALTKCTIAGIFAAGAHSRDGKIRELKEEMIRLRSEKIQIAAGEIGKLQEDVAFYKARYNATKKELNKLSNPWRDAKKELPPIDESDERVSIVVIAKWFVDYDCYIHEEAVYSYEHKRWESTIGKYKIPPDYWMPIPQIKKGD